MKRRGRVERTDGCFWSQWGRRCENHWHSSSPGTLPLSLMPGRTLHLKDLPHTAGVCSFPLWTGRCRRCTWSAQHPSQHFMAIISQPPRAHHGHGDERNSCSKGNLQDCNFKWLSYVTGTQPCERPESTAAALLKWKDLQNRAPHQGAHRNGISLMYLLSAFHSASYFFDSSGVSKWGFQAALMQPCISSVIQPNLLLGDNSSLQSMVTLAMIVCITTKRHILQGIKVPLEGIRKHTVNCHTQQWQLMTC